MQKNRLSGKMVVGAAGMMGEFFLNGCIKKKKACFLGFRCTPGREAEGVLD